MDCVEPKYLPSKIVIKTQKLLSDQYIKNLLNFNSSRRIHFRTCMFNAKVLFISNDELPLLMLK